MAALSLDAAKKHLNLDGYAHDDELTAIIAAAEAAITRQCGPLEATSIISRVTGSAALVLPVYPVISLTSITDDAGTALVLSAVSLNASAGTVSYASGATFGSSFYTVTYSAGRVTCPADLLLGVKELVRHLWDSQRGPSRRPGSQASDGAANGLPGAGYLLPFRVQELMAPHIQHGFA